MPSRARLIQMGNFTLATPEWVAVQDSEASFAAWVTRAGGARHASPSRLIHFWADCPVCWLRLHHHNGGFLDKCLIEIARFWHYPHWHEACYATVGIARLILHLGSREDRRNDYHM